jgi:hypothetical protein
MSGSWTLVAEVRRTAAVMLVQLCDVRDGTAHGVLQRIAVSERAA